MRAAPRLLLWLATVIRLRLRIRPPAHPAWCDPARCAVHHESDGSAAVFHRSMLLDDPGPLRVELYRCVATSPRGTVRRGPDRVYVDGLHDGVTARQAVRLAEAVTRAAMLMAGTR